LHEDHYIGVLRVGPKDQPTTITKDNVGPDLDYRARPTPEHQTGPTPKWRLTLARARNWLDTHLSTIAGIDTTIEFVLFAIPSAMVSALVGWATTRTLRSTKKPED
jgi:hypothetical protein